MCWFSLMYIWGGHAVLAVSPTLLAIVKSMHGRVRYGGSFDNVKDGPDTGVPEYAFIGRSNVGRSSLINLLFGRKDLAYVSKQPGKTQSINYFLGNDSFLLVDLAGYGYARHSKKQRDF